jgi:hypothetical protein
MEISFKSYKYPGAIISTFYITINGKQAFGPYFTENDVLAAINILLSGGSL